MPYPLPLTRTEAYLAYKAGVIQQPDLKPSLAVPRNGIDEWLAYWTGLAANYPKKPTVNLFDKNKITVGVRVSTSNGGIYPQAGYAVSSFIPISPRTTYALVCGTAAGGSFFSWYDSSKHYISGTGWQNKMTRESPANARYIKFDFNVSEKDIVQFEKAPLSPYSPYTAEPLILQEEEAYIAYLCGVINEYPEKCLRRVGAYLRYLISARWGRPDHPLNREELYLSLIKTQFIPSGDPSSDITIEGTCKAPFVDVKMYGDTFQQTYTGKNLAYPETGSGVYNGLKATYNSSTHEITVTGTPTTTWSMPFLGFTQAALTFPAGTYTLKQRGTLTNGKIGVNLRDGNTVLAEMEVGSSSLETTFTISSDANGGYLFIGSMTPGQAVSGTITIQLEAGSTASNFEPFVGGQPSPSPDYPQQIQTVTGEQTVEIVGKNLLNLADKTATERGVSINMSNGNVLSLDGTATSTGDSFYYYSANIKITQDSVLSGNVLGGTAVDGALLVLKLRIQRSDGTGYWASIKVGEQMQLHEGLTIAQFYLGLTSGTVFTNYKVGIQLEKGSTATDYAPYSHQTLPINLGSLELCKLGTYQDYIYKSDGEWKVHKATVKKILTGSENWSDATVESTTGYFRGSVSLGGYKTTLGYSNKMLVRQGSHGSYEYVWLQNTQGGNTYLQVLKSRLSASTLEAFETWLASNNITIYAVPYDDQADTTITDQTLIAQLDSLVNGGAEDGTTYIKVSATDPNLPGLLYVEAPKYE